MDQFTCRFASSQNTEDMCTGFGWLSAAGVHGDVRVRADDFICDQGTPRTSSSLLLVVRPGAPSSVLAPSSDALCS